MLRSELEAARAAQFAGQLAVMRQHLHRAGELALAAGQDALYQRVSACRSGLCLISQIPARINAALALLEELPTSPTATPAGVRGASGGDR